ncbi:hypothetical protein [Virgisporangium aliadipatigenens]|uniref:hypothetical protein n=1 Tax=Virgisporangium aliadipatigenens TaxID=741659 RepID=UPI0019452458|nr:hypothetical protein [Virgisporangium aliadipatigenens]
MQPYPQDQRPAYGYPPPGYPPPPGFAPPPPRRRGRGGLVFLLIVVAVVCLGGPGVTALVYFTQENGPYSAIPSACQLMNGDVAKQIIGGLSGDPKDGTYRCEWNGTDFILHVEVDIYHREKFTDSVENAQERFEFAVYLDRPQIPSIEETRVEQTYGVGQVGLVSFTVKRLDKDESTDLVAVGRTGNAVIKVSYFRVARNVPKHMDPATAEKTLRDLVPTAEQLYNDVAEELR